MMVSHMGTTYVPSAEASAVGKEGAQFVSYPSLSTLVSPPTAIAGMSALAEVAEAARMTQGSSTGPPVRLPAKAESKRATLPPSVPAIANVVSLTVPPLPTASSAIATRPRARDPAPVSPKRNGRRFRWDFGDTALKKKLLVFAGNCSSPAVRL